MNSTSEDILSELNVNIVITTELDKSCTGCYFMKERGCEASNKLSDHCILHEIIYKQSTKGIDNMSNTQKVINEEKEAHRKDMEVYSKAARDHVADYGPNSCDYLVHQRTMSTYYRGCYNAIIRLEKRLKDDN